MQEKLRRVREEESKRQKGSGGHWDLQGAEMGGGGQPTEKKSDLRGSVAFVQINKTICAYKRAHAWTRARACERPLLPNASGKRLHGRRSVYVSLEQRVTSDWGPVGAGGLFSFNSKLAVLVSQPDMQIKKGQTCPLNPGKSPPSHLPQPVSFCVTATIRHMLCEPKPASCTWSFPSSTETCLSLCSHCQKSKKIKKNVGESVGGDTRSACLLLEEC